MSKPTRYPWLHKMTPEARKRYRDQLLDADFELQEKRIRISEARTAAERGTGTIEGETKGESNWGDNEPLNRF